MFFEGFKLQRIELSEAALRVRHGGSGPPVLLLHGHPRTHRHCRSPETKPFVLTQDVIARQPVAPNDRLHVPEPV
jgi:hypothetical protein